MVTRFLKYFALVKPNAFTQIAKVAQLAEVVMIRDKKERIFQTAR